MKYKITFTRRAARELEEVAGPDRQRIGKRIDLLAENPRPNGVRKLQGADNLYRIRAGDFRVIYSIDDGLLTILVIRVGNRRDIYE